MLSQRFVIDSVCVSIHLNDICFQNIHQSTKAQISTEEDKQEYSADVFINTDDDFDDGTLEQKKEYLDNTFTNVSILVNGHAM